MGRGAHYREIVIQVIKHYASFKPSNGQIDKEAILDRENDRYAVLNIGWDRYRRVHGCVIHLDIIGGKVWVQYDGTNRPIAEELVTAGIPQEDIVLAFHPPEVRPHTGFAVG